MRLLKYVLLLVGLAIIVSCDAYTSVRGKVIGPDCQPVEGAVIQTRVDDHPYTARESDARGMFWVECVHGKAEEFRIVVSKAGFQQKVIRLHPHFRYEEILVQLEPEELDGPGT